MSGTRDWKFLPEPGIGLSVSPQILALLPAAVVSVFFLCREIPRALSNPGGFPRARWGWPEKLLTGGIVLFFLFMAFAAAAHPEGKVDMGALGASLMLYLAMILLILGLLVFRNFNLRETFGLDVRGWNGRTVAAWLLMFLPLVYLVQSLSYLSVGPDQSPQAIVDFLLENSSWQARMAVFGLAVIAAPLTEELIFRGCLYGIVRQSHGRMAALLVSSILFALIHGHIPSLPGLAVFAAGLALVYERCGSLWAPILMHAGFNSLTIVAAIFWPDLAK